MTLVAVDETVSWDIISAADIWDDKSMNVSDDSEDGYVLVKQEDIVDGIACFMAAYLLSLKQTKVYKALTFYVLMYISTFCLSIYFLCFFFLEPRISLFPLPKRKYRCSSKHLDRKERLESIFTGKPNNRLRR